MYATKFTFAKRFSSNSLFYYASPTKSHLNNSVKRFHNCKVVQRRLYIIGLNASCSGNVQCFVISLKHSACNTMLKWKHIISK